MSVILLLIPLSLAFAGAFLAAFFWAVRSGQYEDTGTPPLRLLGDDRHRPVPPARPPTLFTNED
ncbi:MAG: cbb3-type cytochrome oxidase assembly protein CcoS [Verrucomicrobia bacterium]|nr:cbb3-type cytochrome oxidase assembly protein CcoS [Verrucomicrobiota bacterium]